MTGTLGQNEVPASGVYLYAKADVKENGQTMAEYATGITGTLNGETAQTSTTTFGPDVTTTRGMIATILWRLAGSPQVDYAMAFDDVAADSWYADAIRWAMRPVLRWRSS